MSFVIAWQTSRSVFLCGDSLVTSNSDNFNRFSPRTSFGEGVSSNKDELCLKIWVIKEKLVVGFVSNDVYEAVDFLYDLDETFSIQSINKSIQHSINKFKPKMSDFIFIYYENGENHLLVFESDKGDIIEENEVPITLGSLPIAFAELSQNMMDQLDEYAEQYTDDELLTLINSAHQNLLIKLESSRNYGVGGLFTGLYLNKDGIFWQKDTMYMNYKVDYIALSKYPTEFTRFLIEPQFVHLIIRENVAVLNSTTETEVIKRAYLHKCDESRIPNHQSSRYNLFQGRLAWADSHLDQIDQSFNSPNPEFYVIFTRNINTPSRILIFRKPLSGNFRFNNDTFEVELGESLVRKIIPDSTNLHIQFMIHK